MRIISTLRGIAVASVGVLSLVGCDALRIDQGVVNTDDPAAFKCTTNDDCLTGYKCLKNVGTDHSICTAQGAGLNCEQFNLDGDLYLAKDPVPPEGCFGLRGDCDDTDPNTYPGAPEICDGKDNSCSGVADDGLDDMPCPKQLGVCAGARTACTSGEVESCDEPVNGGMSIYESHADTNGLVYSETELCDGVDNNCDGRIDEGCCNINYPLSGQGAGAAENKDCNCVKGQAFACGTDTGTCSRGVRFCDKGDEPGLELPCLAVAPEPTLRFCNPEVDEWVEGSDEFCVTERIGVMEDLNDACQYPDDPGCVRSVWRKLATVDTPVSCASNSDCTGNREICAFDGVCRPTNVTPIAETCNGLDDDCNGSVDNHFGAARNSPCQECPFNTVRMSATPQNGAAPYWTCVDIYEASRPDATPTDAGSEDTHSVSVQGVLPWTGVNAVEAKSACEAVALRDLVGGQVGSANRERVVPYKTLCEPYDWVQMCSGEHSEGPPNIWNGQPAYPYSAPGSTYVAGNCNDATAGAGELLPTGSMADCWRPDPANSGMDFEQCTADGNCRVFPVDMVGNALEWTANKSGLDNPSPSSITQVFLMGGSYQETSHMTCRLGTSYQATVQSKLNSAVRTTKGREACSADTDCPGSSVCVGTTTKLCVNPCDVDSDCSRGVCDTVHGTTKACVMPNSVFGDYSGYDDVGFRCCAAPLAQ